jgi:hypothetical protein
MDSLVRRGSASNLFDILVGLHFPSLYVGHPRGAQSAVGKRLIVNSMTSFGRSHQLSISVQ